MAGEASRLAGCEGQLRWANGPREEVALSSGLRDKQLPEVG